MFLSITPCRVRDRPYDIYRELPSGNADPCDAQRGPIGLLDDYWLDDKYPYFVSVFGKLLDDDTEERVSRATQQHRVRHAERIAEPRLHLKTERSSIGITRRVCN